MAGTEINLDWLTKLPRARGDPYFNSILYSSTRVHTDLIDRGINPGVYFTALRALVVDYGFNTALAFNILDTAVQMSEVSRRDYIRNAVFTLKRKVGYAQMKRKGFSDIKNLEYTGKYRSLAFVQKPTISEGAYSRIPKGPIAVHVAIVTARITVPPFVYDEAYDVNIHLMDEHNMANVLLRPDSLNKRIRFIVSNRSADGEPVKVEPKYRGETGMSDNRIKRVRNRIGNIFEDAKLMDYGRAPNGLYAIPEWSVIMIARREARIRWMIEKTVRSWRIKKLTTKRRVLWGFGYSPYRFGRPAPPVGVLPGMPRWEERQLYELDNIHNWIRETTVSQYDTSVLKPVYDAVLDSLNEVVHSNYPVTDDELGYFLQEWLDITWEQTRDTNKITYAVSISKLLQRYTFDKAHVYFYEWLIMNGIIAPIADLTWTNLRLALESFLPSAAIPVLTPETQRASERLAECYSFVSLFEKRDQTTIPVQYTDKDFLVSVEGLLEAKADMLENEAIHNFPDWLETNFIPPPVLARYPIRDNLMLYIILAMTLDCWSSTENLVPLGLPDFVPGEDTGMDSAYSTVAYSIYEIFPMLLNFGRLSEKDEKTMESYDSDPNYQAFNNYVSGYGYQRPDLVGGGHTLATMTITLSDIGTRDATESRRYVRAILGFILGPLLTNVRPSDSDIVERLEKYTSLTDLFFSSNTEARVSSTKMSSVEDDEIMDAIIKLDGMSLDSESSSRSNLLHDSRERVFTIHGMAEHVIEIEPTIEYYMLRSPFYQFKAYFVDTTKAVIDEEIDKVYVSTVTSKDMRVTMRIPIPAGKVGIIGCEVMGMNDIGITPNGYGSMPSVRVVRENISARTGKLYTQMTSGHRPMYEIRLLETIREAKMLQISDGVARGTTWSYNYAMEQALTSFRQFEEYGGLLFDMKELLKFCLIKHLQQPATTFGDPWYYRPLWYGGSFLDQSTMMSAIAGSTSAYKDIVVLKRHDMTADIEIHTRMIKKTLKVLKRLHMVRAYNKELQKVIDEEVYYEVVKDFNTIDVDTISSPIIDPIMNGQYGILESVNMLLENIPYFVVLNYIIGVLTLLDEGPQRPIYPCYPEEYREKMFEISHIRYGRECAIELLARLHKFYANMSLRKNQADMDTDITNTRSYEFDKEMTKSWNRFVAGAASIPKDLPVFREIKASGGDDFEKDVVVDYDPDMAGFGFAIDTLNRFAGMFRAAYMRATDTFQGSMIGDKKYIGYDSSSSRKPYFIEIVDSEYNRLYGVTPDPVPPGGLLGEFRYLALGDYVVGLEKKMQEMENEIVGMWHGFLGLIPNGTEIQARGLLDTLMRKCREYNRLLL